MEYKVFSRAESNIRIMKNELNINDRKNSISKPCLTSNLLWLKNFLCKYRSQDFNERVLIPTECYNELTNIFRSNTNILLNFAVTNPLSVKETLILALHLVLPSQKEIAEVLLNSPGTIKSSINRICLKLGVKQKTEAVYKAMRLGILQII